MNNLFRRASLTILAAIQVACSTISVVADTRSGSQAAVDVSAGRLAPGDDLRLSLVSGEQVLLRLVSIEPDALVGTATKAGTPVRVPKSQIERIEREETDWMKTTMLIAAIVVAVYLVVHSIDVGVGRVD